MDDVIHAVIWSTHNELVAENKYNVNWLKLFLLQPK
jgi:hypothetical protein